MTLSKADFFKDRPPVFKVVEIPELGGSVHVKKMTTKEKAVFEDSLRDKKGERDRKKTRDFRQLLAVATVVDENGQPLFSEADIDQLGAMDFDILDSIADASIELNYKANVLGNSQPLTDASLSSDGV